MADRVYLRLSTDKQTDARRRHALTALPAAGAHVYEDPATSSRRLSLDRAGFTTLLYEAAVGDTIRIADAARLFRSVADILALLDAFPAAPGQQHGLPAADPDVVLDLPGLLADHLRTAGDEAVRRAIDAGRTIRRGQGHSVRVTAPLALHRAALQQSAALAVEAARPAARKAHRVYATRIAAAEQQPPNV